MSSYHLDVAYGSLPQMQSSALLKNMDWMQRQQTPAIQIQTYYNPQLFKEDALKHCLQSTIAEKPLLDIWAKPIESIQPSFKADLCVYEITIKKVACIASKLMTKVLSWRNPSVETLEEIGSNRVGVKALGLYARSFVTELSLPLIGLVAVVESVAYAVLAYAFLHVIHISSFPAEYSVLLLKSSTTTSLWSIKNIFSNVSRLYLSPDESLFRRELFDFASHLFGRSKENGALP